ncbi:hypothetical protein D3C79_1048530 [compost metagenome]
MPQLPGSHHDLQVQLQPDSINIDEQQALAIVEKLPGGEAILVAGGVAIGVGQGQPPLIPAFGQQLIKVRTPGPVMAQVAIVGDPAIVAPFQVRR